MVIPILKAPTVFLVIFIFFFAVYKNVRPCMPSDLPCAIVTCCIFAWRAAVVFTKVSASIL